MKIVCVCVCVFFVAFVAEQQNWPQRQPSAAHCDAKKKSLACTGVIDHRVVGVTGIEEI